jgi:uncharacterized protein YxjI
MFIVVGKTGRIFNVCNVDRYKVTVSQLDYSALYSLVTAQGCLNYKAENSNLVYTQGSETNLPGLNAGGIFVIQKILNGTEKSFKLLDTSRMSVGIVSEEEAVRLKKTVNIVNAKVVTVDGNTFLSSLEGNFIELDLTKTKSKNNVPRVVPESSTPSSSLSGNLTQEEIAKRYISMPVEELTKEYGTSTKMSYIESRAKKGSFGKKITKALAIGLIATTLMSLTTACGPVTVKATTPIESTYTQDTLDSKIVGATDIVLRSHKTSIAKGVDVVISGEILGTVKGEMLHIYDNLTFKDINDTVVATSGEKFNYLKKDLGVADAEGNLQYQLESHLMTLRAVDYTITDASGTELGSMKSNMPDFYNGEIKDTEGKVIALISGNLLNKNVEIKVKQKDKIDNKSLVMMATTFTYGAKEDSGGGSKSSGKH